MNLLNLVGPVWDQTLSRNREIITTTLLFDVSKREEGPTRWPPCLHTWSPVGQDGNIWGSVRRYLTNTCTLPLAEGVDFEAEETCVATVFLARAVLFTPSSDPPTPHPLLGVGHPLLGVGFVCEVYWVKLTD